MNACLFSLILRQTFTPRSLRTGVRASLVARFSLSKKKYPAHCALSFSDHLMSLPGQPVLTYSGMLRSVCLRVPCLIGKILRIIAVSMRLFFFNIKTHSTKILLSLERR